MTKIEAAQAELIEANLDLAKAIREGDYDGVLKASREIESATSRIVELVDAWCAEREADDNIRWPPDRTHSLAE